MSHRGYREGPSTRCPETLAQEPVILVAGMRNNALNAKEFRYEEIRNSYDGYGIEAVHSYGSGLRMPLNATKLWRHALSAKPYDGCYLTERDDIQ